MMMHQMQTQTQLQQMMFPDAMPAMQSQPMKVQLQQPMTMGFPGMTNLLAPPTARGTTKQIYT